MVTRPKKSSIFLDFRGRFLYIIEEQTDMESNLYSSFYKLVASKPKCAFAQTCETVDKSSKSIDCYIDSVYRCKTRPCFPGGAGAYLTHLTGLPACVFLS